MIQFQGQASTPGREEVLQVAELLAAHGREPGAIAAAGWAAAQAEAVTVSAMPGEHIDTAEFVGCMAAVDDDTIAYWQHADADRWQSETPTLVSEAATRIAARSDRAFFTNPADARLAGRCRSALLPRLGLLRTATNHSFTMGQRRFLQGMQTRTSRDWLFATPLDAEYEPLRVESCLIFPLGSTTHR